MANQEQLEILKQGAEIWNQWRAANSNSRIDLSGSNIYRYDFSGANLSGVNLRAASFFECNFDKANFEGANFTKANLSRASFLEANLSRASFLETILWKTNFTGAILNHANLIGATFEEANLANASLVGANLMNGIFRSANLTKANLSGADLSLANLVSANLSGADLSKTKLFSANLVNANLSRANFDGSSFIEANLNRSDLSGAKLRGADLSNSQLVDADLSNVNLTGACLKNWNINNQTKLDDITCKYVYLDSVWDTQTNTIQYSDRIPHTGEFAQGDFQKICQKALSTVTLLFRNGIDWQAFLSSFQQLQAETGEELSIRAVEDRADGTFVVTLNVPVDIEDEEKTKIEEFFRQKYSDALKRVKQYYHQTLSAQDADIERYHEQNTNLIEAVKLLALASKSLTVGGNLTINADGSVVSLGDISGQIQNQVTKNNPPAPEN
jgi:uncharacterized protein YjbI with pentapeptide repeats